MTVVTESSHQANAQTYVKVWVALLILTLVEVLFSEFQSAIGSELSAFLILLSSLVKAALVALFFMHLFWEKNRKFLIVTVFILPLLIVIPFIFFLIVLPYYF